MGHTIDLVFRLQTLRKILRVQAIYQPHNINIRGPGCRLQYFCWIEGSADLKDFQPRGKGGYITRA